MAAARDALLCWALLVIAASAQAQTEIQVLHVNDIHARFTPADVSFGSDCDGEAAAACFGGFAKQATAISAIKQGAAARGVDTLVLHAGDQYTGTLWDAAYTKNDIQIAPEFLKALGIQAFTLGDHEFNNGIDNLAGFLANISGAFPVLSCNLDTSGEPRLNGLVQRYTLLNLPLANMTVGVVGLTTVDTPEISSPGPTVKFLQYNDSLPGCVKDARAEGADLIILLSHIGYGVDMALAASSAAEGVDLIVGGHSQTLLYGQPAPAGQPQVASQPPALLVSPPTNETDVPLGPYPTLIENPVSQQAIPVVQAMYASRYLGVLNTTWQKGGGLVSASGSPLLLGGANSTNPVADDPQVAAMLAALEGGLELYTSEVAGSTMAQLDGSEEDVLNGETNLGDFTCDAILDFVRKSTNITQDNPGLQPICIINGGSISSSIPPGNITEGTLLTVFPYGNWIVTKVINASTLTAALNNGLSGWTGNASAAGRFPQVGGFRYAFDPSRSNTSRLVAAEIVDGDTTIPLTSYSGSLLLITNDYLSRGGDYYDMFADVPVFYDTSSPVVEVLADYIQEHQPITTATDGRIANCQLDAAASLCRSEDNGGAGAAAAGAPAPQPAATSAAPAVVAARPLMALAGLALAMLL